MTLLHFVDLDKSFLSLGLGGETMTSSAYEAGHTQEKMCRLLIYSLWDLVSKRIPVRPEPDWISCVRLLWSESWLSRQPSHHFPFPFLWVLYFTTWRTPELIRCSLWFLIWSTPECVRAPVGSNRPGACWCSSSLRLKSGFLIGIIASDAVGLFFEGSSAEEPLRCVHPFI